MHTLKVKIVYKENVCNNTKNKKNIKYQNIQNT